MTNYKFINRTLLTIFIFLYTFFLLLNAPRTVQGTDTGELVTNEHLFRVIHPPGYPLYTWLYGFFSHAFHFGSPFFRAAVLTIILAVICIIILSKNISWPLFLALVTTPLFLKYCIIPDVFLLHIVLSSLVIYCYKKKHHLLSIIFFYLGLCHHLTIIFLAPIIFDILRKNRKNRKKIVYYLTPALIVPSLYLSMLFFDTKNITSWGELTSPIQILFHFLRHDYGTHKLAINEYHNYFFSYCLCFIERWYGIILISVLMLISTKKRIKYYPETENVYILLSLAFYILIFFNMASVAPDGMGREIIDRFLLMPALLLIIFTSHYCDDLTISNKDRNAISICALFICFFNIYIFLTSLNFSKDNRIESWAIDRLNLLPASTIVLESSDVGLFSLYYVQNILNIRKDVSVISPVMLFHPWYFHKVSVMLPVLKLNEYKILKEKNYNIENDLITPNIDKFKFHVRRNFTNDTKFKIIYDRTGRLIEKGTGTHYAEEVESTDSLQGRKVNNILFSYNYDSGDDLISDYCIYNLSKGIHFFHENKKELFYNEMLSAIKKVPYCLPAYKLLCENHFNQDKYCELEKELHPYAKYF